MEHFVTLFDSGFLPQGISLHESLIKGHQPFKLWIICMDELVEKILLHLNLEFTAIIPLSRVESTWPKLRSIKLDRSRAEYCWTLTPFAPEMVFLLQPDARRVTYIDADLYFFGPASSLLSEMDEAGADVMVTDHAYAPEYLQESTSGKYCVQFVPFRNTTTGREILSWWQSRCSEWCYARFEDGKFGDQKYLESWSILWPGSVHTLRNTTLTLAPWNARYLLPSGSQPQGIYHFHGLRIFKTSLRLWSGYKISKPHKQSIYYPYLSSLMAAISKVHSAGFDILFDQPPKQPYFSKSRIKHFLCRTESWIPFFAEVKKP